MLQFRSACLWAALLLATFGLLASAALADARSDTAPSPSSERVREVQELLKSIGYPIRERMGFYGNRTRGAVTYFQREKGLRIDGVVSGSLLRRIRAERFRLEQVSTQRPEDRPTAAAPTPELAAAGAVVLLALLGIGATWLAERRSKRTTRAPADAGNDRVVAEPPPDRRPNPRLGEILLSRAAVDQSSLTDALRAQGRSGGRLGEILLARGAVGAAPLRDALSEKLGVQAVQTRDQPVALFSPQQARALSAVALASHGSASTPVAFSAPDEAVVHAATQALGTSIEPRLSDPVQLERLMAEAYGRIDADEATAALRTRRLHLSPNRAVAVPALPSNEPLNEADLPSYSILVPVAQERSSSLSRTLAQVASLEYPRHKLDVICLVEADDHPTRAALAALDLPPNVRVAPVPPGDERGRQRALLYGLRRSRGEIVSVTNPGDKFPAGRLREAALFLGERSATALSINGRKTLRHDAGDDLARSFLSSSGLKVHFDAGSLRDALSWTDPGTDWSADASVPQPDGGWAESVRDFYRFEETYDWVAVADKVTGPETFFHRSRARSVRRLVRRHGDFTRRVLDAGCGTGLNLRHLPEGSVGIDLNPRHVETARERLPNHEVVRADIESLPFGDASFSMAVCTEVLEHVPDPFAALEEIRRVLRPGGTLIGSVPARSWIWKLRFLSRSHPGDEPFHNEYLPDEVRALLTGFEVRRARRSLLRFNVFFAARKDGP